MKKQFNLALFLIIGMLSITSCTTQEEMNNPNEKYIELYNNAYENLSKSFLTTRAEQPLGAEVTVEEISSINSLEILTTYDKARLIEIQNSDVYQNMRLEGQQYLQDAKAKFLPTHPVHEYSKLVKFTQKYIREGTHNMLCLQQSLQTEKREEIKNCMSLCASLVDAYGKEHIWKDTFQIASLNPCDKAAIEQVSLILVGVALDLFLDATNPWVIIFTSAKTIKSICDLVSIHNEWVECLQNLKKED